MAEIEILILDRLQARMAPGRVYDPDELESAGLVPDPDGSPNDGWHLRVPVRRRYASREDIASYATRHYPGCPVTEVPAAELAGLAREHLDYGTYFRLFRSDRVSVPECRVPEGRVDGRSLSAWKRFGKLDGCPDFSDALDGALAECRSRRGAAVFIRNHAK